MFLHGNVLGLEEFTEYHKVMNSRVPLASHAIFVAVSGLVLAAFGWSIWTTANVVIRGSGRMRPIANEPGNETVSEELGIETAGRIAAVHVKPNDPVHSGQLIVELDTRTIDHEIKSLSADIALARVNAEQAETHLMLLETEFSAAERRAAAELAEAKAALALDVARRASKTRSAVVALESAREQHARLADLALRNFVSRQEVSESRTAVAAAEQSLAELQLPPDKQHVHVLEESRNAIGKAHQTKLQSARHQRRVQHAAVEAKELKLAGLQSDRKQSRIVSPVEGVVTLATVSAGDVVQPGKVGITIIPQRSLELLMTVAADDVGGLHNGMPVRIKMDAFDYQDFGTVPGEIRMVSTDSLVDESSESGAQQAIYIVRVKLMQQHLVRDGKRLDLKLGMTGVGEIVVERKSLLSLLLRKVQHTISL